MSIETSQDTDAAEKGVASRPSSNDAIATPPYSVYTLHEKWLMIVMIAIAGFLSPMAANIYFPVLPLLSTEFNKSIELINLTITGYLIFQGVSPMFWSPFADRNGRRPIYLGCLVVLCVSCIGLALTPTSAYWLLLVLRCTSAAGSASMIALGAGVIVDIAVPSERGSFLGVFTTGPLAGPCIGPIIGGALSAAFGWRSIFWFFAALTGVTFIFVLLFLPETLRALVGNGSVKPPILNRPLVPIVIRPKYIEGAKLNSPKPKFANPLRLFAHADVLLLLVYNGIVFAVFYGVTASISPQFHSHYPYLTEAQLGLCFIPIGAGAMLGAFLTGRMLDREYRTIQNKYNASKPLEKVVVNSKDVPDDFPLERARMRLLPVYLIIYLLSVVAYGWTLEAGVHISAPLVFSFFIGWMLVSVMNPCQNLLMDLFPSQGAAITATVNITRCWISAALVSFIDVVYAKLNPGWTCVLLAGICTLFYPMSWYELHYGYKFRAKRNRSQVT